MKKIAFAVVASLAFSTAAMAQSAPAAVDPAIAKAVGEMLVTMKYQDAMKASLNAMAKQMPAAMLKGAEAAIHSNPKLSAEQKASQLEKARRQIPQVGEAMKRVINDPALMDEMAAELVPLYARHFTLDEIRQLTAFYRTPLGAKMLTSMPVLMQEGMQLGQKVMGPRVEKVMQQMQGK